MHRSDCCVTRGNFDMLSFFLPLELRWPCKLNDKDAQERKETPTLPDSSGLCTRTASRATCGAGDASGGRSEATGTGKSITLLLLLLPLHSHAAQKGDRNFIRDSTGIACTKISWCLSFFYDWDLQRSCSKCNDFFTTLGPGSSEALGPWLLQSILLYKGQSDGMEKNEHQRLSLFL